MDSIRKISSQTSSRAHSRKRLWTVFHGPNSAGKSLQGAPVFRIHKIPLNMRRSSLRFRPLASVFFFSSIGPMTAHFSSEMSCLLMANRKAGVIQDVQLFLETGPRAVNTIRKLFGGREPPLLAREVFPFPQAPIPSPARFFRGDRSVSHFSLFEKRTPERQTARAGRKTMFPFCAGGYAFWPVPARLPGLPRY